MSTDLLEKLSKIKFGYNIFNVESNVAEYLKHYEALSKYKKVIKKSRNVTKIQTGYETLQKCDKNLCPQLVKQIDGLKEKEAISKSDAKPLTLEVNKEMTHIADKIISESLKYSIPIVVLQTIKLYMAFGEITQSENLAKESKAKIELIKNNMKTLEEMCTETKSKINKYVKHYENASDAADKDTEKRRDKLYRIKSDYFDIRSKYNDTKRLICQLKNQIDLQLVKLKSYQDNLTSSAVENLAGAMTSFYQIYQVRKSASYSKLVQMFGFAGGFTSLAATNWYASNRVGNLMETLKAYQEEINSLEKDLVKFEEAMKTIGDFIQKEEKNL